MRTTEQGRLGLLEQIWMAMDEAYDLMDEYDALPHRYGANVLYQAEAHIIDLIARYPDITITDLANLLRKSPSACSQIVRKLKDKGWVDQMRNEENNRQIKLRLTESGMVVYRDHDAFDQDCRERTFRRLAEFSDQELAVYVGIQRQINDAFQDDVRRSREYFR